jgi:beta-lactamase class A
LNNGGWFGINEKETFSPASLMKLPVLLAYLKKAEQNPSFLEMQVIYKEDPRVASYKQNIPPEKQLVPGNSYSLWDILQYMITYSDNHASLLLESMLSLEDLHHTFTDLGILFPQVVS